MGNPIIDSVPILYNRATNSEQFYYPPVFCENLWLFKT